MLKILLNKLVNRLVYTELIECYGILVTGSVLCIWTICELVIRGRKCPLGLEYVSSTYICIELLGVVKVAGNKSYIFNLH